MALVSPADISWGRRDVLVQGVPLYWIVDAEQRQVEVWTPEAEFPRIERKALVWHPAGAATPFRLDLGELFRPV